MSGSPRRLQGDANEHAGTNFGALGLAFEEAFFTGLAAAAGSGTFSL
jgi:hypothetical protein